MTERPISVLFACTHNSAAASMPSLLLAREGGPDFEVRTAGTVAKRVNPYAIRARAEVGIDWSAARSESIAEFLDPRFDDVITVFEHARETCPVFPGLNERPPLGPRRPQ